MADLDTAPTTSYSDPIYDRLEQVAQRIRRLKWLILGVILASIAIGVWVRANLKHNPGSASAVAYAEARELGDETQRKARLESLLGQEKTTPFFRARAALDLAQMALFAANVDEARRLVEQAKGHAAGAESPELELIVGLGEAAVAEDAKELDAALAAYEKVAAAAGARFPVHALTAAIGAARVEQQQGKHTAVLERLGAVLERTDEVSQQLMPLAKAIHWESQRASQGGPKEAPKPAADATAPAADGAAPATAPATD